MTVHLKKYKKLIGARLIGIDMNIDIIIISKYRYITIKYKMIIKVFTLCNQFLKIQPNLMWFWEIINFIEWFLQY